MNLVSLGHTPKFTIVIVLEVDPEIHCRALAIAEARGSEVRKYTAELHYGFVSMGGGVC